MHTKQQAAKSVLGLRVGEMAVVRRGKAAALATERLRSTDGGWA